MVEDEEWEGVVGGGDCSCVDTEASLEWPVR